MTTAYSNPLISDFFSINYSNLHYETQEYIDKIQTALFLRHLEYIGQNSPFYKNLFYDNSIDIREIRKLKDIEHLPFTSKSDFSDTKKFLAVNSSQVADVCLTSATSGSIPTAISQTQKDLARLAYNEEQAFKISGIIDSDTILICAALDRCFMAGLAYFLGGVKLGCKMLRGGAGSTAQHWELIKLSKANVIIGVPSFIYKIGQYAIEEGEDPAQTSIRKLIAIGEPTKGHNLKLLKVSDELEKMWDAKIYSTYASSELATSFCECEARLGGHLRPELNIIEIISENGQPVSDGELGEVVTTPLGITGMPLIRFKTDDISFIIKDKCECGRTTKRLAPIIGRKNQMLKYKGTTVFPNAIIAAFEGDEKFYGGYVEARKNSDGTDLVILYASLNLEGDLKKCKETENYLKEILRAKIRVVPEIVIIPKEEVDKKVYQFDKKRKRVTFFDLR